MISFDEKGPESLCAKHGRGWARRGRPERHRATFYRRQGDPLPGRRARPARRLPADQAQAARNGASTLAFMKLTPPRLPEADPPLLDPGRPLQPWTPAIRAYADGNNIELVPTPTYASYLNRIESTFGAIDEFVCKNADYLDWDAFGHALADHVRYRNSPAERERRKIEAARRRQRRAAKTTTQLKLAA